MFSRHQRKDRRRGYSFPGHFRRVLRTKGLSHIVVSMGGTLLLAGGTLAYCSGGSITAPPPPNAIAASAAQPPRGSITSTDAALVGPATDVIEFPEIVFELPAVFNNPCTGDPISGTVTARWKISSNGKTDHWSVHTKMRFEGQGPLRLDGSRTSYGGTGEDLFQTNTTATGSGELTHVTTVVINAKNHTTERADDFRGHITEHFTFRAPPKAAVNHMRAECN